ncbi:MAG: lactate racemase domain-containing protein [Planctomycetaceae bacterium]
MSAFPLNYGSTGRLAVEIADGRLHGVVTPPPAIKDVRAATAAAIASPIEFPSLRQAMLPEDQITIVIDLDTPAADQVLAGVWDALANIGVDAGRVTLLHPASVGGEKARDPRGALPREVSAAMHRHVHDPTDEQACSYLATTASGDRIYLAKQLVEADYVICIGAVRFDAFLGYRGTFSAVYPGLSDTENLRRAYGAAHVELGPDDPRPMRERVDEVGWLLGAQFVVQVVPAANGGVARVFAGLAEPVFAVAKQAVRELWGVNINQRVELVIAAVEAEHGVQSWSQVAHALEVAGQVVSRDGRVLLLTQLDRPLTPGLEILRDARTPRESIKPIQEYAREDKGLAMQLAHGVERANVYLLSRLPPDQVEELFMVPLVTEAEAFKVLETGDEVVVLGSAQNVVVRHTGDQA